MKAHIAETELIPMNEIIEDMTWNRQRTTEELLSFINGHHAQLDDVELGI